MFLVLNENNKVVIFKMHYNNNNCNRDENIDFMENESRKRL